MYVTSSAGARWREVRASLIIQSRLHVAVNVCGVLFISFTIRPCASGASGRVSWLYEAASSSHAVNKMANLSSFVHVYKYVAS